MTIKNFFHVGILLLLFSCKTPNAETQITEQFTVKVIVEYGESKQPKEKDIITQRPLSALEALQYASIVETHPVDNYVFVSSIDSVYTIKGVKAWYYKVNGESPGILAINNKLNNGDTIRWIYKTDVCSHKANH